ncbi:MAG TPA: cation:proton antiporter, partial [bacterium]|nr:cation:proton antiporter [bacterium]
MLDITRLLVQIGTILLTARLVGWVFRKIHQPQVVGEMAAGLLLGPSFLGWIAPGASAWLFPRESFALLGTLSQVGLIVYMFLVGAALNPKLLKERAHTAIVTSHVSIVIPFLMGLLLAVYLYPRLSGGGVPFSHFALFLGISMSITAFPVLARILTDRRLSHTGVGAVAITCAAVDDITAWCLLAGLILFVRATGTALPLWATVGGSLAYVGVMIFAVRPALATLMANRKRRGLDTMTKDLLAVILMAVLASAWITEHLGIHALFGAFLV